MDIESSNFDGSKTMQSMTEIEIGNLIKQVLKAKGMTQTTLAQEISWSYETVNGTINFTSKNKWSLDCLRDMLKYLELKAYLALP